MIKVYGSKLCPDCESLKINLGHYHIEYEYLDVCENLKYHKEFLSIRDSSSLYDEVKKNNSIGIPTIIDGDKIYLDWETYLSNKGFQVIKEEKKLFAHSMERDAKVLSFKNALSASKYTYANLKVRGYRAFFLFCSPFRKLLSIAKLESETQTYCKSHKNSLLDVLTLEKVHF